MQTGWFQASGRVTRRLPWDPTCLPLSLSFLIKNKQTLKVLKSRRQYNLFLENCIAFKGFNMEERVMFCIALCTCANNCMFCLYMCMNYVCVLCTYMYECTCILGKQPLKSAMGFFPIHLKRFFSDNNEQLSSSVQYITEAFISSPRYLNRSTENVGLKYSLSTRWDPWVGFEPEHFLSVQRPPLAMKSRFTFTAWWIY